jgi:hypothetical protein
MEPGERVTLNPQPIPPGIVWMTAAASIGVAAVLAAWGSLSGNGDFGDYWPVLVSSPSSPGSCTAWSSLARRAAPGRWAGPASCSA